MDGFIGRKKELELMDRLYAGSDFEFIAIYGRRRVGKTALIEKFLEGKRAIFFSARRTKGNSNVRLFNEIVKDTFGNKDEKMLYFDDLFRMIADNADERLVLVIDEFPYFAESDEDIISALQVFIDRIAKNTKLFLILCGSSMGFMKRQVLGYESPLYGRRTHEMHIRPMDYRESAEFLEGRSNYEKACVYGAVGGIPLYLRKFSGKENIFRIMEKEFFSEGSVMSSEPESLILQELKNPKKYNDIIEAMARGLTRIGEISDRSGIAAAETSRYLDDLIDLGYVEKVMPLNENAERRSRYYLSDNLFRFYYQMVAGRRQVLSGASPEETSGNLEAEFPSYMGRVFETMCAQYVKERMGYPLTGKWWGSPSKDVNAEVDLIGSVGKKGRTEGLFAECKFTNRPAGAGNLERLKENAGYVKGFDVKRYAIFSRSGFDDDLTDTAEVEGVSLVTLDMMYGA
ncbi:MAG: ATP-binding protein [Methanomassiliicoccaceae archaeon]|nr:ATP-binding protein [Methanomassiliicoccaceae archaeon]